jgi:hypothetical protein
MNMTARRLLACTLALALGTATAGADDPPKPQKKNGHSSVPTVTVTFRAPNFADRKGLLIGSSHYRDGDLYSPFRFAYTEAGRTGADAWWDTIAAITETSDEGATIVFKNGQSRAVRFGQDGHRYLLVYNPEGGREVIDLEAVKELRVGRTARKDADGNGMFDHWKFSPFTGEKLPPVEAEQK